MRSFKQYIEDNQLCTVRCFNLPNSSAKVPPLRLITLQHSYEPYYMKCGLTNPQRRPDCMQPGIEAEQTSLVFDMGRVPFEVHENALRVE